MPAGRERTRVFWRVAAVLFNMFQGEGVAGNCVLKQSVINQPNFVNASRSHAAYFLRSWS